MSALVFLARWFLLGLATAIAFGALARRGRGRDAHELDGGPVVDTQKRKAS